MTSNTFPKLGCVNHDCEKCQMHPDAADELQRLHTLTTELATALQNLLSQQDNIPVQLIRNSEQYLVAFNAAKQALKNGGVE